MDKPDLEFDDVEPIRQTSIPTATEIARGRALKKLGLTSEWYAERLESIRDTNGSPVCETCARPETKKRPGGKIRDLVVSKNQQLICQACANKAYKALQKANIEKRYDGSQDTLEKFWEENRQSLSENQRALYEESDERVSCLVALIKAIVKGEGNYDVPATIREFCNEYLKHGMLETGVILEWEKGRNDSLARPEATYLHCGFVTALPARIVRSFLAFAEKFLNVQSTEPSLYYRIGGILRVLDGKAYQSDTQITYCYSTGCKNFEIAPLTKTYYGRWHCPTCNSVMIARANTAFAKIVDKRFAEVQRSAAASQPIRTHDSYGRPIIGEDSQDSHGKEKIYGEDGLWLNKQK